MADKKRVPQKNTSQKNISKSVFDDTKRPTEFFCCRCGKYFPRQATNFPTSRSGLYAGNNGFLPICKTCVGEIFQFYLNEFNDPFEACERVCAKFDYYYTKPLLESIIATCTPNIMMTTYIGRLGVSENKAKSYDDYLKETDKQNAENAKETERVIEEHDAQIIEKGRVEWGLSLDAEDYEYLDNEFADWSARCAVDGKTRESLVRDICVLKLLQSKSLLSGDIETYNKLSATLQKTLTTAELTPRQESDAKRASEKPMGVMIEMFENERPIPEPSKEWEDVDGIQRLIRVFFIGHLCKMLGIKNKYSAEYEDFMAEYSAVIPDEIDDDSEDIYDYLMEHGFSDSDPEEEDGELDADGFEEAAED